MHSTWRRDCRWLLWGALVSYLSTSIGVMPVNAQAAYSFFPANPQPSQPTNTGTGFRVTLVEHDSTIESIINEIARQAHLQTMYNSADPAFVKRISVRIQNVAPIDAFATALQGTGLMAKLTSDGERVMIRAVVGGGAASRGQETGGILAGRVTDSASGNGLGGALVKIEGTALRGVTSDSGNFALKGVPAGEQVLSVKLFGYRPAERTVTVVDSQRTTVRVVLVSIPTVLSGVVTTATGLQRKIEVGNDITSLNVDSIMRVAPITSVTDLLETRVPGLTVLHSDGVPGDPSRLRLRGAGSVQLDNDPIVIVDGVRVYASQSDPRNANLAKAITSPGANASNVNEKIANHISPISNYNAPSPLDQIDPNNIETIEVFKGPSASALYGSDAASGVIVITTKHGRAGPTHWGLALGQGINWIPGSWPTNYYKFGTPTLYDYQSLCSWTDVGCTVDSLVAFQALNDPRYTVFSHGSDQTANLTISGGVSTLQYSLTGSAAGDVGNLKLPGIEAQRYDSAYGPVPAWMRRPDNYQTWGIGGSITAHPDPKLQVTLTSNLFNSNQQRSSLEGAISQLEGTYIGAGDVPYNSYFEQFLAAPLIQNDVERATDQQLSSTNALTIGWQLKPWLPITASGGLNTIQRTDATYIPFGVCIYGPGSSSQCDTSGSYGLGRGTSRDQTLTAGTTIPLFRQRFTLAVGGNVYDESTADFTAYTNQLSPGVSTPTAFPTTGCSGGSGGCSTFDQSTSSASTYGWYVEPRLNFASRFFVAPGFRLDGGSGGTRTTTSGGNSGLSAFPKINLSYVAVDRQSQRPLGGVLTLLRPRLAFGYAGTQPLPQDKLRLFNVGSANYTLPVPGQPSLANTVCTGAFAVNGVPAVCLNSLGNPDLRPERSSELEGGFDATLWQGRVSLTYSQYNKTRHDAILEIPVAPSVSGNGLGGSNIEKNVGVIRNTGTELTINAFLVQSRALSWNVGANLSNDNSLVVSLNKGQSPLYDLGVVPGYPLFSQWALPIVAFADVNHNGVIEPNEFQLGDSLVYVGQQEPKYQFNLTTDITLLNGRLSIHGTFAYQNGLLQTNGGALGSSSIDVLPNTPNTPLATQAAVVAADCGSLFATGCRQSTLIGLMQTVSTFRFNKLSINYEFPHAWSVWVRVPRMTVALQGDNLALHTNYRGKDPDVNAFSTVSAGDETADLGQVPEPRTWWLKFTLGN